MKRYIYQNLLFSSLILLTATGLRAQVANDTANSWLKISPSTRNVGMGEALAAVPDAFDEVDINPALIGLLGGSNFSVSQDFWAQGLSMQHLVYSQRLENNNGFSFGVDYINFGSIALYTVSGPVITANGSYSPIGLNVYGGYGLRLSDGLRVGLTAHFIYDNIQQSLSDQTASFDGGLFYQMPGTPLSLSAVLSEIGLNLDDSALPVELKTAWAYEVDFEGRPGVGHFASMNRLTLSAEGDWLLDDPTNSTFGFGGEYWYQGLIALRAGYRFSDNTNLNGLSGFSLGMGVRYMDWQVDYALTTIGDFGTSNQISLSFMIGEPPKTQPLEPIQTISQTPVHSTPTVAPNPVTVNSDMWELYEKGRVAYLNHQYSDSIQYFKHAEDCKGNEAWQYAEGYAMLGVIYEYRVNSEDHLAIAHFYYLSALKLDPQNKIAKKHIRRWKNLDEQSLIQ